MKEEKEKKEIRILRNNWKNRHHKRKRYAWALIITLCVGLFGGIEVYAGVDNDLAVANTAESAPISISAPSALLMEASTGQIIFEQNATEQRSPASITKIMTLLLAFEYLESGKGKLTDQVLTSQYASSMGGSQVFLAEGEMQSFDTMLKCIAVSSANDASVAVAEHIAGSEAAFVELMNQKALELGMENTHFMDCCGLSDSDEHYTSAKDVAIMSRELIQQYPEVYDYTGIWMEDIVHETKQGTIPFTLSSTNKLLKQYQWTTGLKTGSTSKAKFCLSATARKEGIDMIAVVMGAPDHKVRFEDAKTLLHYGFQVSDLYVDENRQELEKLPVEDGTKEEVGLLYAEPFRYLDTTGRSLDQIEKKLDLPGTAQAPITKGSQAGAARYFLDGKEIGSVPILYGEDVPKAVYLDYLKKLFGYFLIL